MENYSHTDLFGTELYGASYPELKLKADTMDTNYREPVDNFMTDDGIYTYGLGATPMINTNEPSLAPMIGDYQDSATTPLGYANTPADLDLGMANLQLPTNLTGICNSILNSQGQDSFPIGNLDFDISAAAYWPENDVDDDDFLGNTLGLATGTETNPSFVHHNASAIPDQPKRQRRTKKVKANGTTLNEMPTAVTSPAPPMNLYYPQPEDLGVPSPTSSNYSDTTSSNDDNQRPRQRRPRVSYSTLTEEEKYKRIRDLNNEASRNYRQRQRSTYSELEGQMPHLLEENKRLKEKAAGLEKLRDELKHFTNGYLTQHMTQQSSGCKF